MRAHPCLNRGMHADSFCLFALLGTSSCWIFCLSPPPISALLRESSTTFACSHASSWLVQWQGRPVLPGQKGGLLFQGLAMQEGTTSLLLGTEDLKYLKTISLTAKNQPFSQHYLRNQAFQGNKKPWKYSYYVTAQTYNTVETVHHGTLLPVWEMTSQTHTSQSHTVAKQWTWVWNKMSYGPSDGS